MTCGLVQFADPEAKRTLQALHLGGRPGLSSIEALCRAKKNPVESKRCTTNEIHPMWRLSLGKPDSKIGVVPGFLATFGASCDNIAQCLIPL